MGVYLNPGAAMFRRGRRSKIYIDKSMLIASLNEVINTERRYACVSRPQGFGKSMVADMVCAYYDCTTDGEAEFAGLAIASAPSFDVERNQYDVIRINMQEFLDTTDNVKTLVAHLSEVVCDELARAYPAVELFDSTNLVRVTYDIFAQTANEFVIVIDEWDCVMRELRFGNDDHRLYLDFLRAWLKDKPYVALAYMTGILPIKKCGTQSGLNMFDEYSMLEPYELGPSMGFTEGEVEGLCRQWGRDLAECRAWYDGYRLPGVGEVYSPRSVVRAMETGRFDSYWTQTETFEALKRYIDMDMDGLHGKVVELMGGARVAVNPRTYGNDMTTFNRADDVLTLLIHLGYLGWDADRGEAFIPNREIMGEYAAATADNGWGEVARSIAASEALLDALLAGDADAVAQGVERTHGDVASVIAYNHEEDLACTLRLAFFSAVRRYRLVREAPAGKGYADLLMVPLASAGDIPGVVVELKWGASARQAVAQIRERGYAEAFRGTAAEGNVVLCGIAYDRQGKTHTCAIELS